jgi:amino acid transporter
MDVIKLTVFRGWTLVGPGWTNGTSRLAWGMKVDRNALPQTVLPSRLGIFFFWLGKQQPGGSSFGISDLIAAGEVQSHPQGFLATKARKS